MTTSKHIFHTSGSMLLALTSALLGLFQLEVHAMNVPTSASSTGNNSGESTIKEERIEHNKFEALAEDIEGKDERNIHKSY